MHVPGQARRLDNQGRLVATTAYPRFQEELRSRFPFLVLAMNREDELWCIVRRDPYRRGAFLGVGLGHLVYTADVYTPVLYLNYIRTTPEGEHDRVFLRPGNWVFRKLKKMHASHLGFDDTKQTRREMLMRDDLRRKRLREAAYQRINDGVADWSSVIDHRDPGRFRPSVRVLKP